MSASLPAGRADARAAAAEIFDVVPGVMNALRTSMRRHVGDGMSIPQFRCLAFVGREPDCSVSAVATFLGVTLATASTMVDRLVRAGFVQSVTAVADRRRSELRITTEGKSLVDSIRGAARRDLGESIGHASDRDLDAIMEGMAALRRLFKRGGGSV